jgi:enamine deaminase RidA (YjgF/YER057c/UK114 family)
LAARTRPAGQHRSAITVLLVAGLGSGALVEIDAIAVIPS